MAEERKPFEHRFYCSEVRAQRAESGTARLEGQPIVYDSKTDIGGWFAEVIERGALDGADLKDVPLLVNHDRSMIPIARSRRNNSRSTMRLTPNQEGLSFEADVDTENNMTARELVSAVERSDVQGMSFAFTVDDERWENLESDYPTRHILRFGKIAEISAVTFPAYEATSINARDKEALESARSAMEIARQSAAAASEDAEKRELELLKEKTKILGGIAK